MTDQRGDNICPGVLGEFLLRAEAHFKGLEGICADLLGAVGAMAERNHQLAQQFCEQAQVNGTQQSWFLELFQEMLLAALSPRVDPS